MNDKNLTERPLMLAIKYLSHRPRTVYEMSAYIKKKGFPKDIIRQVITILLEENYLNDKKFTKLYIDSMVRNRPKSKFALGFELKRKGVNQSIIEPALESYDDMGLAIRAVTPKIKIWKNLDTEKFKKKLINFLKYRGFNYEICIQTLKTIEKKM